MNKIWFLALIPILFSLWFFNLDRLDLKSNKWINYSFDLDSDGIEEDIYFHSYTLYPQNVVDWKTEVFMNDNSHPKLVLAGLFEKTMVHNIDTDTVKELEIQVLSGKSTNTLIYRYRGGELVRIPVSTENSPYYEGVVSRNEPEFKDMDGDGIQEMMVYYRHFPPDFGRTTEVYQLNEEEFKKVKEYEESTPQIYL